MLHRNNAIWLAKSCLVAFNSQSNCFIWVYLTYATHKFVYNIGYKPLKLESILLGFAQIEMMLKSLRRYCSNKKLLFNFNSFCQFHGLVNIQSRELGSKLFRLIFVWKLNFISFKWAIPGLFFYIFDFLDTVESKQMFNKSLPMTGFKLRISGVSGDRSTN